MLKIRLRRMGSRHRPFYRVVVSDSRRTPTASALDEIGTYDPRRSPSAFRVDFERFDMWLSKGARPSDTVRSLAKKARKAPASVDEATEAPAEKKSAEKKSAEAEEPAAETKETAEEATVEAAPESEAAAEEAKAEEAEADETPEAETTESEG